MIFQTKENNIPKIGSENLKYEPGVERSKYKFRIYSKRLFLTYSRTNLKPEEVLSQLRTKFSCIEKYVVSQQEHSYEPEDYKHIHAYIEFNKKVNIVSASKLDLKEEDKVIHGEYTSVKNKNDVITSVKKNGNYISNVESDLEFNITLQKLASEKGLEQALNYFVQSKPELVCTNFYSIRRNLESFLSYKSINL